MNLASSNSRYGPPADGKATTLVDTVETAIDFVLALEHPCMPHLPYQDPPSTEPANHMMMASTSLMARSPDPPQFNSTWTASGTIIKELLNLSSSINLEGEMTPVEAWHRLHDHPDFWKLNQDHIEKLKQELSTTVRCRGYVDPPCHHHSINHNSFPTATCLVIPASLVPADTTSRFGAVLDENVFWQAVNRCLASSTVAS